MQSFNSVSLFFALFFISVFITLTPIHGLDQPIRKLDESPVLGEEKCNLCNLSPPPPVPSPPPPAPVLFPPPPPPPVPSPPPPAPVLFPPPPPPPTENPPSGYCPPPPFTPSTPSSPSIINITSPPGGLYPIDNDYNDSSGGAAVRAAGLPVLIGCGLLLGILLVSFVVGQE